VVPRLTPNRKQSNLRIARGSGCAGQHRIAQRCPYKSFVEEMMAIIEANISKIETMEDRRYAAMLYKTLRCCGPFCTTNSSMYTRAALRTQTQATLRALRPRDQPRPKAVLSRSLHRRPPFFLPSLALSKSTQRTTTHGSKGLPKLHEIDDE